MNQMRNTIKQQQQPPVHRAMINVFLCIKTAAVSANNYSGHLTSQPPKSVCPSPPLGLLLLLVSADPGRRRVGDERNGKQKQKNSPYTIRVSSIVVDLLVVGLETKKPIDLFYKNIFPPM